MPTSMEKPRIFLGSSGKQAKLLQALTRALEYVTHVEPLDDMLQSWDHEVNAEWLAFLRS
jgi:hypothetical protein